jgi:hypothetical protein
MLDLGRRNTLASNATVDDLIRLYPIRLTAFLNLIMLQCTSHNKFFDFTIINLDPININ